MSKVSLILNETITDKIEGNSGEKTIVTGTEDRSHGTNAVFQHFFS